MGDHTITIREANERDIPAIAGLLDALNAAEGYEVATDIGALTAALKGAHQVAFAALVADAAGSIVGTLLYYPGYDTLSASHGYHLADMVVDATHRRSGVGRALVGALADKALAENKAWLSLTALRSNEDAQAFYRALGMREVDVNFFAIGKQALASL